MSRFLVTGGAGFVGSNFVMFLLEQCPSDAVVVNIDKLIYGTNPPKIDDSRYFFYKSDLNDAKQMTQIIERHQIDTVVHLAAQTHVDISFWNSIQFTRDNVLGTHTLLECCRLYGKIDRFIHFSTDEVYGEVSGDHLGCAEQSILNPTNPYAATKAGAEFLVRAFGHSFKLPYIITRANNIYGPYQFPDKVVPLFANHLFKGEKCDIQGDGSASRTFIHVQDVCNAIWTVLKHGKLHEIYNIGSMDEYTVLDIQRRIAGIILPGEKPQDYLNYVEDRPFNDQRYAIDLTKLRKLGWEQNISFDEGLGSTIDWYKNNGDYWKESSLRWLVFGHTSWIGQKVCRYISDRGGEVFTAKSRPDDQQGIALELDSIAPERVVNIVNRNYGHDQQSDETFESQGRLSDTIRDNLYAPLILAVETQKRDLHLTYIGNGCMFSSSSKASPLTDKCLPDFYDSSYSIVNGFTERLVAMYDDNVLNCRINMPVSFDQSPRNLVTKLTQSARVHNAYNSITVLDDILPNMIDLAQKSKTGTYNMTNPGTISHNEILEMYSEIVDEGFKWKNIDEKHNNNNKPIPGSTDSGVVLETGKLEKECPDVLPVREAVRQTLVRMAMLKFNLQLQNE